MVSSLLQQMIDSGESLTVEFLTSAATPDRIGQTVCAFLNTQGGSLILGVADDGQIVGVEAAAENANLIQQDLLDRISPKAAWSVNVKTVDDKDVIVIDVPQGIANPYVYGNGIFVRHDAATRAATNADITALLNRRHAEGSRWERLPALGFEIDDLDQDAILQTASEAQEKRLYRFNDSRDVFGVLDNLNLASGGMILNSAVILFGKNPAHRFPQVRVRAARFKQFGSTPSFADNRTFEGHAFELVRKIEQFLRDHIPIISQLPEQGVQRRDKPAYPWLALREAILNAIVHRDYSAFDGSLSVAIHDDRIEIWNSGELPKGITVESLKLQHPSRPHNPDIANAFFLRGFIERWGHGTQQIVSRCLEAGLPEPKWQTEGGGVSLTIRLQAAISEIELNARQRRLLNQLKSGARVTPGDYFNSVAKEAKERRARKDLLELFEAGYLRREGQGRSTVYVRTEKPLP